MAGTATNCEPYEGPWSAIQRNFTYLHEVFYFRSPRFVNLLYERRFLSKGEMDYLRNSSTSHDDKVYFLTEILTTRPPEMFSVFCEILISVGQHHVAEILTQGRHQEIPVHNTEVREERLQPDRPDETTAMLKDQVVHLDQEKRELARQLKDEKFRSEKLKEDLQMSKEKMQESKEEIRLAKQEAARERLDKEKEQMINFSLKVQMSSCPTHHTQIDDIPTWTKEDLHLPIRRPPFGRMVKYECGYAVAGWGGELHVFADDEKWDMFVRVDSEIRSIVCHKDICLLLLYDRKTHQHMIERFCWNEDRKWRFVTVLPTELQLAGVSVALHDNSLYALGGETSTKERVSTARMFDLCRSQWIDLDDMQTSHYGCCSLVIDNTLYVGGGLNDEGSVSNSVECLHANSRKWIDVAPTTNNDSTLTSISNTMVVMGGLSQHGIVSNVVESYDERSNRWLPLPHMKHKRWGLAALTIKHGKLIAAGGYQEPCGAVLDSVESLQCY